MRTLRGGSGSAGAVDEVVEGSGVDEDADAAKAKEGAEEDSNCLDDVVKLRAAV